MKPETEKALRAASTETRKEIAALLFEVMEANDFVAAIINPTIGFDESDALIESLSKAIDAEAFVGGLCDAAGNLTKHGEAIHSHLNEKFDDETILSDADADRLHEAICEGRRQDAVDILNEVTDANYRTVEAQTNLFPDRCSL